MRGLFVIALMGCTYTPPGGTDIPPNGDDAAPIPDATQACPEITKECVSPTTLRSCEVIDQAAIDIECPWACLTTGTPHCAVLVPAGSGLVPEDIDTAGLADVVLAGNLDGANGSISGVLTRGPNLGVDQGIDYQQRGNNIGVFRVNSLQIAAGGLVLEGSRAIAIIAQGPIVLDGVIDARGLCAGRTAGPGGHDGGDRNQNAGGDGGGDGSNLTSLTSSSVGLGGAGGGYGDSGGSGGSNVRGIDGGSPFGDAQVTILVGGGGGGGGNGSTGGVGGGGGGAIQLVSNTSITINTGGGINAGGCGGKAGSTGTDAGGGGGSGGTILLEAPAITVAGTLAVNGGSGGRRGADGVAGRLDRNRAQTSGGSGTGGEGAAAGQATGVTGNLQAGGGGGIGRMRFHVKPGGTVSSTGTLSPTFTDNNNASTCTQAEATLQ